MVNKSVPGGTDPSETLATGERLQKILAQRGWGSRRVCEDLIADGRVTVNGVVAILGRRVDIEVDQVAIDGAPVGVRPDFVYYLLNKPTEVISTARDTHNRATVTELVPREPRVYPVGRLDADSEGLLLLTNDGELTNRITHPSHGVEKEYLVHVRVFGSRGWRERDSSIENRSRFGRRSYCAGRCKPSSVGCIADSDT